MLAPPSMLCGVTGIAARPGTKPTVVATAEVALPDGSSLKLTELEWQLDQFEISDREIAAAIGSDSIHTFIFEAPEGELHLEQSDSSFWSSSSVRAEAREPPPADRGQLAPRWRKRSNRCWPHVAGVPVPFICQVHLAGGDIYLFRESNGPVFAHRIDCFSQDVEDHYEEEDGRRGAT